MPPRNKATKRRFITPPRPQEVDSDDEDESQIIGLSSSSSNSSNSIQGFNSRKRRIIGDSSPSNLGPVGSSSSSSSIHHFNNNNRNFTPSSPYILPPISTILPPSPSNNISHNNISNNDVIVIEDDVDEFRRHGENQSDAIVLNSDDEQDDIQIVEVPIDSDDSENFDSESSSESNSQFYPQFTFGIGNPLAGLFIPQLSIPSSFGGMLMRAFNRINRNAPPEPPRNQADIKKVKYNPPDGTEPVECTICLEKLKRNTMAYKTGCEHMFHIKCLDGWLKTATRPSCPNCRADLHK